jgi:iron complex outermembrane receptor protein/vitamin B12 transporter
VIDATEITARNDSNALDLLSDIPGVHVNLPGGRGNIGELFIRGGEPNFTFVLIDGVRVNDPTNTRGGSFDFSTLNIDDIERVEIIRGPSSSVYGSGALSGVINVITRSGTDTFLGIANAEAGDGSFRRGGFRLSGPATESSRFSVGLGIVEDGNSSSQDSFNGSSITAKLDLAQSSPTSVSIYARHTSADSRGFPDSSGGPELAVIRNMTQRKSDDNSASVALTSQLSPSSELHFAATYYDHRERVTSPGVAAGFGSGIPANRSDSDFSRGTLNLFVESALTARLDLAAGLGYEHEDGESSGKIDFAPGVVMPTGYQLSRDVLSAYAELGYRAATGIGVLAAVRTDDTGMSGRETTGKIVFDYGFGGDHVRIRLARADAFKLPSLFGLADPLVGNPNLRPETAKSWELGLDLQSPKNPLLWQITAFQQRFEDLIDFDFGNFMTVNRSQVDIDGIDIGGRYDPTEALSLSAHLTYTDIDVPNSDVALRQRPDLRGGVGLLWRISRKVSSHAAWQYIDKRIDASIPTGERTLPRYSRIDVALTWNLRDAVQLNLAIDNLSDSSYEEAIGFPATGRRVRLSIQKTFGENTH